MNYIKLTLFVLIVSINSGFSQNKSPEVNVRIAATVIDYIEMITLADIDVGTVIPSEGTLRLNPRTDSGAGIIKIQGRPNSTVQVVFSSQVEMVSLLSNNMLSVTYKVSGHEDNDQSASDIFVTNPQYVTLNNMGEYYLWIGCEFDMSNLVSGQYDGDFMIEVDYN